MNILDEELICESMSLMPVSSERIEHNGEMVNMWSSVFPKEWSDFYAYAPDDPYGVKADMRGEEPPRNPHYRDDLSLDLSNRNMHMVMDALGFAADDTFLIPIDRFINVATHWLRQHIDKRSQGVATSVQQQPGKATMIDFGTTDGYLNEKIAKAARIAREGKQHGATHISVG